MNGPWPTEESVLVARIARVEQERNRLRIDLWEVRDVVTSENFAEMQERAEKAEAALAAERERTCAHCGRVNA